MKRQKAIRKLHIEAPEYNPLAKQNKPDEVPVIKYIVIYKSYEQPKTCGYRIRKTLSRHYCVGILTERNEYYRSYFGYNRFDMSKGFLNALKSIFITRYRYSPNTKILIFDDISRKTEPLMTFVQIVASCNNLKINKVSESQMFRTVCRYYKCYGKRPKKKSNYQTKRYRIKPIYFKELSEKMIEKKLFVFITDPDWEHKLHLKPETEMTAELRCAQGILYLNIGTQNSMYIRKHKEKKKKELEEKTSQEQENNENPQEMPN